MGTFVPITLPASLFVPALPSARRPPDGQLSEQRRINKLQADQVSFETTSTPFPRIPEEEGPEPFAVEPGDPVHTAIVTNGSHRPISNVVCRIGSAPDADDLFPQEEGRESNLAVLVGRLSIGDRRQPRLRGDNPSGRAPP